MNEDKNSREYKLKAFLKENNKEPDKFSNINITPKYLYSKFIMNKIKKLRDIFLEFDEDGSSKNTILNIIKNFFISII
jgi:hypothetical protein